MMGEKSEIVLLTSLRGVGSIIVVIFHFRREFGNTLNIDSYTHFFVNGYLWVDFFFILSGFVMGLVHADDFESGFTWRSYKFFIMKRLGRIYPLHIFVLLLFVLTEFIKIFVPSSATPAFSTNNIWALISNIFLIHSWHILPAVTWNTPSWSISAEWAAYLAFPLLVPLVMRRSVAGAFLLALGLVVGIAILARWPGRGSLGNLMQDFGAVRCLYSFSLGLLIYRWWRQPQPVFGSLIGSSPSVLASLVAIGLGLHFGLFPPVMIVLFCWLIAAASCAHSQGRQWLSWRPIHYLGVISYSIYMDHALIERVWQFIWDKWASKTFGTAESTVTLVGIVVLVVFVASLTYRFIEVPGRRAVPRWFSQKQYQRS